ncbi:MULTISPECIES: hypothetical protein [unclassified Minwuia]|jgi:chemotaxis regulatin CheY-phosphate phosphatase CheZ|uniref:hypothetical protein n=1 Tax=unclassified Minwuia TaxID=2618799 RepID=UPI00247AB3A6|nr:MULTISPECIES: hypothetical protein [unclassified Minwuia]
MSSETPWSVRGVEPETREAAKVAARRAGLTLGQWLNRTIRNAVAEQLGTREAAADTGQLPALANEVLLSAIQEQLDAQRAALEATFQQARPASENVETTHLREVQEAPTELSTRLQGELDEIKLLIHDYLGLLLPVAEPVQELSRQLQDIGSLSQDVRRAADAAEKAAASVLPLERAVMRMSGEYRTEEAGQAHERRGGGLGKLFGN